MNQRIVNQRIDMDSLPEPIIQSEDAQAVQFSFHAYDESVRSEVGALWRALARRPIAALERFAVKDLLELQQFRAACVLSAPQAVAWVARDGGAVCGVAAFSSVSWDSHQLGLRVAHLEYLAALGAFERQSCVKRGLLRMVLYGAREQGVQYMIARTDASDLSSLHTLEEAGFVIVDGLLTFSVEVNGMPVTDPGFDVKIRLATPADSEAAASLARQAYVYDRFHSDPAIPKERADELHASWLRSSCAGDAADAVVLAEDDHGLLGYVTCNLQRDSEQYLGEMLGTIVLVATADRARRRGIARAMTHAALQWFRQQGVSVVQVGTQLRNVPASRLYESCGFRLVASGLSLRKLL